jgi:hypothetical protein
VSALDLTPGRDTLSWRAIHIGIAVSGGDESFNSCEDVAAVGLGRATRPPGSHRVRIDEAGLAAGRT